MTMTKQAELKAAQDTIAMIEVEALEDIMSYLDDLDAIIPVLQDQLPLMTNEARQYVANIVGTISYSTQALRTVHQNHVAALQPVEPLLPNPQPTVTPSA
jgi:hypothetical protein